MTGARIFVVVVVDLGLIAMRLEMFDDPVLLPLLVDRDGLDFRVDKVDIRVKFGEGWEKIEINRVKTFWSLWIGSKAKGKWNRERELERKGGKEKADSDYKTNFTE